MNNYKFVAMDFDNPYLKIFKELQSIKDDVAVLKEAILNEKKIKRFSPKDIADNTPLSLQTIRAAIKDGRINAKRFGRKYLITADEFDRVCKDVKSIKYKRT